MFTPGLTWTHVHFIKNAECARSIRENGRGRARTYFADKFALLNFIGETFFMNVKGRVKEDGAFKFYEQGSSRRGMSYHAA